MEHPMPSVSSLPSSQSFAEQPLGVKVGVALALMNSWVLFEEIGIDRNGWARFLPLYRVGRFCTYDVVAITLIAVMVFWFPRRRLGSTASRAA
jgi:hypothetical protein